MSVILIAENILEEGDFASATEQEGEHIGQPEPNSANTGNFRLLSKGGIADFSFNGTTEAGTNATTIIDATLNAFGDDYFIGGTVTMTSGAESGNTRAVSDFAQVTGTLTVAAFGGAPGVGETFTLIVAFSTRDFRLELIGSGDAGNATFKWSHNGGTTYFGRDNPNQADWLARAEIYNASNLPGVITQASNGNVVCIYRQSADDTLYRTISTDLGLTWGAASQIDAMGGISPHALITLSSGRLYLLLGLTAMYSDDNGSTWTSKFSLGVSLKDIIEHPNGNLIGTNDGGNNIYIAISSDRGVTFTTYITVTTAANDQQHGVLAIAENGDMVCVYDTDEDAAGQVELKCKISADGGVTWGTAINVINYPGQNVEYPVIIKDIDGRLFVAAKEVTADQKIVFTSSADNGATWAAKADLKSVVGADLYNPDFCLLDGHLIFCLYTDWTNSDLDFVRRGIWETYSANACPCAIEVIPQHLICEVSIVWHGGAGDATDDWQFEAEYDYSMVNLIEDSPSQPWRSEQDNIVCNVAFDVGVNERFYATGVAYFGCNVRTLNFQMSANNFGATPVNEAISFDLCTGIVDAVDGNVIQDTSLMADYRDHELAGRYYLRMTAGVDNGVTWLIKDNVGDYIFLDTTAAIGVLATDTFAIFQKCISDTFTGGLYRYFRNNITAQHTAENYYQLGTMIVGKVITLTQAFSVGHSKDHVYDIEMLRTPHGGMIPIRGSDRKRRFNLSWNVVQTTRQEITALLDYVQGKNIALIPDSANMKDCYLVKLIGDARQTHIQGTIYKLGSITFEEIL